MSKSTLPTKAQEYDTATLSQLLRGLDAVDRAKICGFVCGLKAASGKNNDN